MKAFWITFKKKNWDTRSPQEQKLLKWLGWGLLPLLGFALLWQPAHQAVTKLNMAIPAMNVQVEKMRSQADEVEMLRHRSQPAVLDAAALKAAVEEMAVRHDLRESISALDLQQPNAVRITLISVSFEQWLRWMRALQQEQHIRAEAVSVSMLSQPGMVKINATLINGGAQ